MIRTKNEDVPLITQNFCDGNGSAHSKARPVKLNDFLSEQEFVGELDIKCQASVRADLESLICKRLGRYGRCGSCVDAAWSWLSDGGNVIAVGDGRATHIFAGKRYDEREE